jgi:hypothetical protein
MHINLVRAIHSIQNSCITYSTQNQHFAEMFTYSDNTSYNLNFCYFIVSSYLWFHLFGNYSYVSWCQWWPRWNFRVLSTAPITAPSSTKQPEFALSQQWLIRVESCGRAKPLRGECNYTAAQQNIYGDPRVYCKILSAPSTTHWRPFPSCQARRALLVYYLRVCLPLCSC